MEFKTFLKRADIAPEAYLKKARTMAKRYGVNYKTLDFSHAKHKKLRILDDADRVVDFGSSSNGDFITWTMLERRHEVPAGYAKMKQNVFWRSHTAMQYDRKNPYAPNNLALEILW